LQRCGLAVPTAVRRLEHRLDYDPVYSAAETPPSVLVCIGSREERVHPILRRPWIVETDPDKADFIIATQVPLCGGQARRLDRRGQTL
jgi:hypothetical protein